MKSKSIGSLILLAVLAPSCGGGGGGSKPPVVQLPRWTSQYRLPTTSNLRAIKLASADIAIAAGEAGTFVRTDDGGVTWQQLEYFPASRGGDVLAMSAALSTLVAVGNDDQIGGGSAAWTSLNATTFSVPDDPTSRFAEAWVDVNVVQPASGGVNNSSYRLRGNGMVDGYVGGWFNTKNSSTVVPANPWTKANGLAYVGLTGFGFVCGDSAGGQVRQTLNGGDTWTKMTVPGGTPSLNRFALRDSSFGYVCGDGGAVIHMKDGINWLQVPPAGGPTADLLGITFLANGATGWVVGRNGTIYKLGFTAPSTYVWTLQASGTTQDLYDVAFVDSLNGYAVGDRGTVLKTINGGTNWTTVSQPAVNPFPDIKAVDFSSNGLVGLAVGDGGVVLRTLDGGLTWVNFNGNIPVQNLTGVCIPRSGGGNTAYLCGAGNTVRFHTTLTGSAAGLWTTPSTLPAGTFEAIHFSKGDLNGVCVGGTTMLSTIDGGVNWVAAPAAPVAMHALASSPNGATVYAVGDSGTILSSVDDLLTVPQDIGTSWTAVVPALGNGNPTLRSVQAPTGSSFTLFVAADDEKVYRLSAGITPAWTGFTPLATTKPVSLSFSGDTLGWVVTQGGTLGGVFYTADSGATWTRSVLHVKPAPGNDLQAIRMVSTVKGTAVGDGGMIIKTLTGGQ